MKTAILPSALNGFNEDFTRLLIGAANSGSPYFATLVIIRAKRLLKLLALLMILLLWGAGVMATNYYTYTDGSPNDVNKWWTGTNGTGEHPTIFTNPGDVFIIQNNNTMTATTYWTVSNLTINTGATLNTSTNDYILYLGGNFTNNGTFTAYSSKIILTGNVDQSISGFTTSGSVSMSKGGGTATFVGNVTGSELIINGAGGTLNLGTGLTHTFTSFWTRVTGTLNGGSSLLKIEGNVSNSGGTFIPGTGTVEWNGYGDQTLAAVNYNNLILSGSGARSMASGTSVSGNLSIAPTGTATAKVAGGVTINSGTLTLGGIGTASGTWGSTISAATHKSNTYFSATTGMVNVGTGSCPSFTAVISGTNAICSGSSTNLTVTISGGISPYSVVYSGGTVSSYTSGTAIPVSPTLNTTYSLTSVTDATGCTANVSGSATVTVNTFPAAPIVGTITQPTCATATGSVALSGLPASGSWTVTGSPGGSLSGSGTTGTVTGLTAGTIFTFRVTSSGCASLPSGNAAVNAQPATPGAPTVGIITQPTCTTATGSVALSGLPAGSWTITGSPSGSLSGSGTTGTVTGLAAGTTYTFRVISSGCTSVASDNAVINAQPLTPGAPTVGTITQPSCTTATASVALSGLPASGSWTVTGSPNGSLSGSGTTGTVTGLAANTTYTFRVISSGCTSVPSGNAVVIAQPVTPGAPSLVLATPANICAGSSSKLSATSSGNTIYWYTVSSSGTPIGNSASGADFSVTPGNTTIYYAEAKTSGGCASMSRTPVTVTISNTAAPTGSASQSYCAINNPDPTVANLAATGSNIKWYADPTGGTALATSTALVNDTHYYATQTVSGCESTSRLDVTATVGNPAAPSGSASQLVCASQNPTVGNLSATGNAVQWYDAANGGTLLTASTALVNGTHYFASQTVDGCESINRLDVLVTVASCEVFTASGIFVVPENVTQITVQVWGGGGKGSDRDHNCGGGGGGGAYSSSTLNVTSGTSYTVQIGQGSISNFYNGGDSWFGSATSIMAKGGFSAQYNNITGAFGGSAASGYGQIKLSGGNGANGIWSPSYTIYSGGGGSSAGTGADGTHATNYQGATAPEGGGNGGNGFNCSPPTIITVHSGYEGSIPGGGGGGAIGNYSGVLPGGNGANGKVVVIYDAGCGTPIPTVPAQSFCIGNSHLVSDLVASGAEGATFNWYNALQGGIPLADATVLLTGPYYVSQTVDGCESPRTSVSVTVNTSPGAPTASAQSFCSGNSHLVGDMVSSGLEGATFNWYNVPEGGSPLSGTVALSTGTYYVSQTVAGCESPRTSVSVTVNTTPGAPTALAQSFCSGNSHLVSDLVASGVAGATFNWYIALQGGAPLAGATVLSTGTYYVSQTVASCESTRTLVSVTVNTTSTPTAVAQSFCSGNSHLLSDLVASGASGATFNWYNASQGGAPLVDATVLSTGTYYVSQTVASCESPRTSVSVAVNTTPGAPTAVAQSFCSGSSHLVSDLVASGAEGATIKWYDASVGGSPLADVVALSTGTYYVSQTVSGCESPRLSVSVTLNTSPGAPTALAQSFCSGNSHVVSDLVASGAAGATFNWYNVSVGGSPLAGTAVLSTGTYYVSQTVDGCQSLRTSASVTVNPVLPVSVSIASGAVGNIICVGEEVTFSATPTNGGSNPSYQWKLNDANVGLNQATYATTTLATGNVVKVLMTSNETCVTGTPATSNSVTMTVSSPPNAGAISGTALTRVGGTTQLSVTGNNAAGTWASMNTGVATVNSSGLVTGVAIGTATITYTVPGISACASDKAEYLVTVGINASKTFTSSGTFTVPAGVLRIDAKAWGGGGGGGEKSPAYAGCGGGGGGFRGGTLNVSPDDVITITVGQGGTGALAPTDYGGNGANSVVSHSTGIITAYGGTGGGPTYGSNAYGGNGSFSGTVTNQSSGYRGGDGAAQGGGGGGGAGDKNDGSGGSGTNGGAGGSIGGGKGGNGSTTEAPGGDGTAYGGGGGGSSSNDNSRGGNGANGAVIISWISLSCEDATLVLSSAAGTNIQAVCANTPISPIVYTVGGGASGASVSPDLPSGLTGVFNAGTYTISGSVATGIVYNYTVSTTGTTSPCTAATTTGTITVTSTPPAPVVSVQNNCGSSILTATGYTGTLLWSTGETTASITVSAGGNYTVTITNANNCSATSEAVNVSVNTLPAAPAAGAQSFCSGDIHLVSDLDASGTEGATLNWYDVAEGGTPLAGTIALTTKTYFVSQTLGDCESDRTEVSVTVITTPGAPTGNALQTFCSNSNSTIADLVASGTNIQWYSSASDGTLLPLETALVNEMHCYASQTVNGCESINRLNVLVTLSTTMDIVYQANGTFIVPAGVTSITAKAWGGGGGGSGRCVTTSSGTFGGAGGGGGGFRGGTLNVNPGDIITITVGTGGAGGAATSNSDGDNGTSSWVSHASETITAWGGEGGVSYDYGTLGGHGGGGIFTGTVLNKAEFKGGDAWSAIGSNGGGAGGGAGDSSNGSMASQQYGGNGGTASGGKGGNGSTGANAGYPGQTYGGGGGGGYAYSASGGGNGAKGAVIISYPCSNECIPPDSPTADAQSFCSGDSHFVSDLDASGTEGATLNWYDVAEGGTPLAGTIVLTTKTYYASQTIGYCESTRTSVDITVNTLPVVSITGSASITLGSKTTLSPAAGGTWTSSNEAVATVTDGGIVTGVAAGTATFTFTNTSTGCSATTGTITVNACSNGSLTLTSGSNTLTLCANTAITPILYAIGGGATGAEVSGLPNGVTGNISDNTLTISGTPIVGAGSYPFTVTTLGATSPCTNATANGTITVILVPEVSITGNNSPICYDKDAKFYLGGTPSAEVTYSFDGGTTTRTVILVGGTATVTRMEATSNVTLSLVSIKMDSPGCNQALNSTSNVIVNRPTASISGAHIACTSTTLTAVTNASSPTYYWATFKDGNWIPAGEGPTFKVTQSDDYYLIVIDGITGCEKYSDAFAVTFIPEPEVSITGNNSPICYDKDAKFYLKGTPDAEVTYSFDGGTTTRTVTLVEGTTTVTGMEATSDVTLSLVSIKIISTGCIKALNETSTVTVNRLTANITGAHKACVSATLTAVTDASSPTYTWGKDMELIPDESSSTLVVTQSGEYVLLVTDGITGCATISDVFAVSINPLPEVSISASSIFVGETTTLSPTAGGSWTSSNEDVATVTDGVIVTGVAEGMATFTFTDVSTGCSATTETVTVYACIVGSITLTSGTETQTLCAGTAIIPIVYTIGGGATGASISPELPEGLWEGYDSGLGTYTISGTPKIAGIFNYTVTTTGTELPCTEATANGAITVNPLPTVTAGTYGPVCGDADDITLEGSPEGGVWSGTGVSGNVFDPSVGTQTLTYTYTDGSSCVNSATTSITVDPQTVAGSVTGGTTICLGNTSGLLTLDTYTGDVVRWESSVSPFDTWTPIENTADTYTSGALTSTTQFRAVVKSDQCDAANSAATTVTVVPQTVAGSVTGGTTICSGSTSSLLTLDTYTGDVVRWESSVSPFDTWTTIENTADTYTSGALTATTQFRAMVKSGQCGAANSLPTTVTVNPNAAITSVNGGASPLCIGSTTTCKANEVVLGGGSGEWSSSNPAVATVNQSGIVTAVGEGICKIMYVVTGCNGPAYAFQWITVNPNPAVLSVTGGTSPLCIKSTTKCTAKVVPDGSLGEWSSSNTKVATVDKNGKVTAVGVGTCNIIYTVTGCNGPASAYQSITVNPNAAIASVKGGTTPLCIGAFTSCTATGVELGGGTGAWSSSNTAVATVDQGRNVTAIGTGSANITFTITGGCTGTKSAYQSITVNPNAAITSVTGGASSLCIGETTTCTANGVMLGGGTGAWSSSNTKVATVDQSGKVTAVGAGSTNITFTITGSCSGTITAYQSITVNPITAISSVTGGDSPLCIGETTTCTANEVVLGSGTGAWSSNNTAVATVDQGGNVTAVGAGSANITFTITGGCAGTKSAYQSITVNPNAAISSVTGGDSPLCIGSTTTCTANGVASGSESGQWSSSDPAVATVDQDGKVSAVGAGTCNIIYTVTGCNGPASAQHSITVNDFPTVDAGTFSSVCVDANNVTLVGSPTGGVWTGTGVSGNTNDGYVFDPTGLVGENTLTYTYADGNSCVNSDQATILVNPLPTVSADYNSPVYVGSSLDLYGTISGGSGSYTIGWTGPNSFTSNEEDPQVTSSAALTDAGTYSIHVSDVTVCSNDASVNVEIHKRDAVIDYTGDVSVPYSDYVNLSAKLNDGSGALPAVTLAGRTITFTIGNQSTSAVTNTSGVASTGMVITQASGSVTAVTTSFDGSSDLVYNSCSSDDPFTITPENACVNYTGQLYLNTSGLGVTVASFTLTWDILQDPDSYPGMLDVSTIGLTTTIDKPEGGTATLVGSPIFDEENHVFSQTANVTITSGSAANFTLHWEVSKGYYDNNCDQDAVITVAIPGNDFAAGGGYIILTDKNTTPPGAVSMAGTPGTKNNFGFNIKWAKNYSKLTGSFNTIWRQGATVWQAKSNSAGALIVSKISTDSSNPRFMAQITYTNVNVKQLDCIVCAPAMGNSTVILTVYDWGDPGSNGTQATADQIGFVVKDNKGKLIYSTSAYSTSQLPDPTLVQNLAGGNIQVKSSALKQAELPNVLDLSGEITPVTGMLKAYPNPFSEKLYFDFVSPVNVNARIDILDNNGRLVETIFDQPIEAGVINKVEFMPVKSVSGIYIYRLIMGERELNGKVIYKQ